MLEFVPPAALMAAHTSPTSPIYSRWFVAITAIFITCLIIAQGGFQPPLRTPAT